MMSNNSNNNSSNINNNSVYYHWIERFQMLYITSYKYVKSKKWNVENRSVEKMDICFFDKKCKR